MNEPDRDPLIDAAFRALPDVELPAQLRRRIAQIPIEHPRTSRWSEFSFFRNVTAWAVSGALGIICGFFIELPAPGEDQVAVSFPSKLERPVAVEALDVEAQMEAEAELDPLDQLIAQAWQDDWEQVWLDDEESVPAHDSEERTQ